MANDIKKIPYSIALVVRGWKMARLEEIKA